MGMFDLTCMATDMAIRSSERAALVLVQKHGKAYVPIALPIFGQYDKLGTLEHVVTGANERRILDVFRELYRTKRLTKGSSNEPLARFKNLDHLIQVLRQGGADGVWIEVDGAPVSFGMIREDVYRAAVKMGSSPKGASPIERAFGDAPLARVLYDTADLAPLKRALADFATFRAWFAAPSWMPDFGGGLYFWDDMRKLAAKARKKYARSTEVVRAIDAYLEREGEDAAASDASDFLDELLDRQHEAFAKKWKFDAAERPSLSDPTRIVPHAGDVVVGRRPGDVKTLAEAIARVRAGGRIRVRPGLFTETQTCTTKKPFSLVGAGMSRSVVVFDTGDDALCLEGHGAWHLEGLSLIGKHRRKHAGGEILLCMSAAAVTCKNCLFAGGVGILSKDNILTGGRAALAFRGGRIALERCHVAYSVWGAAASEDGSVTLDACKAYGCESGLFAGADSRVRATKTAISDCKYGARVYTGTLLDLERCNVTGVWGAGIFVECGNARLSKCELSGNGGAGAFVSESGDLVARRCKSYTNGGDGFLIQGKCKLEGNDASDNYEHGMNFESTSEGIAKNNRGTKNRGAGIALDPKSRVKLAANRVVGKKK